MSTSLQSFSRQLNSNPRLKIGVALIVAITLALIWSSLHDWRISQQNRAIQAEVELRKSRQLRKQEVWLERASQTATRRKALLAEIPIVATPGIAQATLQNWLSAVARAANSRDNANIEVSPPVELESHPGIYRARASVNANMTPRQAFNFMTDVESATNLTIVETSQLDAGNNNRATINIVGYYRTDANTAEDAP